MRHQKFTPRADYRLAEAQRTQASASLAEKFQELKSLTVEFGHFSPEGVTRNSQIKYTVNPVHAKSVFRLDCPNGECIGGDFDLSEALTQTVAAREGTATGEMCCQGSNPLPQYPALQAQPGIWSTNRQWCGPITGGLTRLTKFCAPDGEAPRVLAGSPGLVQTPVNHGQQLAGQVGLW
jgi:hypothetical protein